MTILSRVCAEFFNKDRKSIYKIDRDKLMVILTDVPDEIQEDPLFNLMLQDGSLDVVNNVTDQKKLELDPTAGMNAEGKKPVPETIAPEKAENGRKQGGRRKTAQKVDEEAEEATEAK